MNLSVEINRGDLGRINKDFKSMSRQFPVAISRVINRTLSAVNTEASVQVRKIYKLTAKRVKQDFFVRKSTKNSLGGLWRSTGEPIGLMQFGAKQKPKGVSIKIMTTGGRKTIKHAFINVSGQNGREQVFRRATVNGKMVPRYDIYRLEGPRIEDALAKPRVQAALKKKYEDTINSRLDAELNYILHKARW